MNNRDFIATWGGKLAVAAAPVMAVLGYVATDPTVAVLLSEFLPGIWRLVAVLGLAFVAYVLPLFASKKDNRDA